MIEMIFSISLLAARATLVLVGIADVALIVWMIAAEIKERGVDK